MNAWNVSDIRSQFPALARTLDGQPLAFLDGPAGTQVPQCVIDAIGSYLSHCNANRGGCFITSRETDQWMQQVHEAVSDFLGARDPDTIVFGANMTSLNFALSRALARTWRPGDEIVVTRLEHDSHFTPWVTAAREAGVTVRYVDIHLDDCTLDLDDFRGRLTERTRLVAVGCASNATGTRNPVETICQWARAVGAISVLDAVHLAPHERIDVRRMGCDFLLCSAYKFFGPHVGILWGRRQHLESVMPYKLRPAPHVLPGRWMTGTQNHECLAGTLAAINYLATLAEPAAQTNRITALDDAYARVVHYERELIWRLIRALCQWPQFRVWGITDESRAAERLPTVAFTHERLSSRQIADQLAAQGICVWHGNYYALPLTERLNLEPDGMLRVGVVHYNTPGEIDRLIVALEQLK